MAYRRTGSRQVDGQANGLSRAVRYLLTAVLIAAGCDGAETSDPPQQDDPAVVVTKNLEFASALNPQLTARQLDVYTPSASGGWPVVVFLHGGAANKEHVDVVEFSERLAAEGVVVFVPTYGGGPPEHVISEGGRVMREFLETSVCAVRYALQRSADFRGDKSRLTVIGHSAGGVFGSIVSLLQDEIDEMWDDRVMARGGPSPQMECTAETRARVTGFVGFNGAYFIFKLLGLPDDDPEFWSLVNLENHVGKNRSLVVRLIFGKRDGSQPAWHISDSNLFIENLRANDYDADTVQVDASHGFNFVGAAWEKTLAATLEVVRR